MFDSDFHAHSLFSACGLHSVVEMLEAGRKRGLKVQAITDHGPFLGRRISSTYYERLNNPVDGIELLKGMECNVINEDGDTDVVENFIGWYDLLLLGYHNYPVKDRSPRHYAEVMIKAIEKTPVFDIIVHPNANHFIMDFDMIAEAAAGLDVAVELNNSKTALGRSSREQTLNLIRACMNAGCKVAVNTDAHALNEVGRTDCMEALLDETGFPVDRIVNRDAESAMKWISERRDRRRRFSSQES